MRKQKKKPLSVEDLTNIPLVDLLKSSKEHMVAYGSETIENRALPDYRDGCKPVYRRILFAANVTGKHYNMPFVKSAKLVGDTMGLFHPHGDIGIYGALVTIANMQEPLLDKHGNFGSPEDGPAAPRYTECRLSRFSDNYLLDPDYLAVTPMIDNYDGTLKEVVYLPSKLPNVLITGANGIAMGCVTMIPSFSKVSVINLIKKVLNSKNKKCTENMCLSLDFNFTYGGTNINTEKELLEYYKSGEYKLSFIPKINVVQNSNGKKKQNVLRISSLAHGLKPGVMLSQLQSMEGVKYSRDVSGRGCKDWIEIVPSNSSLTNKQLLDLKSKVEKKFTVNMSCKTLVTERQDDGETVKFKRTTIPGIVNDWIKWRLDFEVKVVKRLIKLEEEKIQRWEWLIWAIDHLKLVFEALKTDNPDIYLVKKGKITKEHAKYILDQQTRRLSKLSGKELKDKIKEAKNLIKSYKKDIFSKDNISKRVVKGLEAIKD